MENLPSDGGPAEMPDLPDILKREPKPPATPAEAPQEQPPLETQPDERKPIVLSAKVYTNRSNARRAARQVGANPNSVVAVTGGFKFNCNSVGKKKAAPAKPKAEAKAKAKDAPKAKTAKAAKPKAAKPAKTAKAKSGKGGTRSSENRAKILRLITRKNGVTMPDLIKETGLLPHTLRARISETIAAEKLDIERIRLLGVTTYRPRDKRSKGA